MRRFQTFSLLTLLVGITAAGASLAYLRARLFEQGPYAFRVSGIIRGGIPVDPFRSELAERITKLGHERSDAAEAHALASFRMVHNDCTGQPEIFRGNLSNGKEFYIHCYFSPNPAQKGNMIYSITVSFFETPFERWATNGENHGLARDAALTLHDVARSLWAEQWHAQQRKEKSVAN
jgi:hypothetical protein